MARTSPNQSQMEEKLKDHPTIETDQIDEEEVEEEQGEKKKK